MSGGRKRQCKYFPTCWERVCVCVCAFITEKDDDNSNDDDDDDDDDSNSSYSNSGVGGEGTFSCIIVNTIITPLTSWVRLVFSKYYIKVHNITLNITYGITLSVQEKERWMFSSCSILHRTA